MMVGSYIFDLKLMRKKGTIALSILLIYVYLLASVAYSCSLLLLHLYSLLCLL